MHLPRSYDYLFEYFNAFDSYGIRLWWNMPTITFIMISENSLQHIILFYHQSTNTLLFHFCIKIDSKKLIHDLEIWSIKQRFIYKWWKVLWFECHYREDLLDINLILPRVSFFPFFKLYDLSQRAVASKGFTLFA